MIVKVPVLVPATVGLKVTLMVHVALTATLAPQVLVSEKAPVTAILAMLSVAFPVFLSDTC